MKKFKFKLDPLLKLKEAREKQIKVELGEIVKEMTEHRDDIEKCNQDIDQAYISYEKMLAEDARSLNVQFYPYFIKGKKDHIEFLENKIFVLQKKYDAKVEEMKSARADTKIFTNMKEEAQLKHKKLVEKKENEAMEELYMMRKGSMR